MQSDNLIKKSIVNILKLCAQNKGKSNLAKKVLCDYVISSFKSKDDKNFIKLFENLLTNIALPFDVDGELDMCKYKYLTYYKSVSETIVDLIKQTNINKDRRPFGIYLEDNVNRLLNSLNSNLNSVYKKKVKSYNNIKLVRNKYINFNQIISSKNNFEKQNLIKNHTNKFSNKINNKKLLNKYNYILY